MPFNISGPGLSVPIAALRSGSSTGAPLGFWNEVLVSELLPVYYQLLKAGRVFYQQVTAANATGFTGGAGGTPLIGLYNPVGSNVDCVILVSAIATRTQGTAAATPGSINWYGGVSVLPTGTTTKPVNAYSQQASGSSILTFVNTAMTASSAGALTRALVGFGANPGTTAPSTVAIIDDYPFGSLVAAPGVLQSLGAAATTTAASFDVTVYWAEVPA
jgi:hypothetical protein